MLSVNEANQMVWRFQPGHYEVWYATFTHLPSRTGFWVRYTLEAPLSGSGSPGAALWFARFDPQPERTFGFHRRFGIDELRCDATPFWLRIGKAELRNDGMAGSLAAAGQPAVEWDLKWQPAPAARLHLPTWVYGSRVGDTHFLSPNNSVLARGTVTVDGERYEFDAAPLSAAHLWGRRHPERRAWAHCSAFDEAGVSIEALSVQLQRGRLKLPLTLFSLYLEGKKGLALGLDEDDVPERIEFREPWQLPFARSNFSTGSYSLFGKSARFQVEAHFRCRPQDMIVAEYRDPDGGRVYCHNTECADAEVTLYQRSPFVGRFRRVKTWRAERAAYYEWVGRTPDPAVQKRHVSVD